MERIILTGSKQCLWDLGNGMKQAGVPLDLSDKERKKAEKEGLVECYVNKEGQYIHEKPKKSKETITEEKAYDLLKKEQIELLEKLEVKPSKKNNNLKYEKDRVKAILEAQK